MTFIDKIRQADFYFIAEGADAHYGDMSRAKSMQLNSSTISLKKKCCERRRCLAI
jgi:hypothetical protein